MSAHPGHGRADNSAQGREGLTAEKVRGAGRSRGCRRRGGRLCRPGRADGDEVDLYAVGDAGIGEGL